MPESTLAEALEEIIAADSNRGLLFRALLAAMGEVLGCDRCFLMVRHPQKRIHRNFCWLRRHDRLSTETEGWQLEAPWEREDPMFAAALRAEPSIFVDDIETALPCVLNIEFERNYLGHRALVHAHIIHQGQL